MVIAILNKHIVMRVGRSLLMYVNNNYLPTYIIN